MSFELFGFAFFCHINATVKYSSFKPKGNTLFQKSVTESDLFLYLLFSSFLSFFYNSQVVLVSAAIELIFFLLANVVLCFGFGVKIMLITYKCFQLLLGGQALFSFSCWPARYTGSWEGTQLGQLTQTGQKDILFHMMSC